MKFKVGDKVKHKEFGVGEIVHIDEEIGLTYAVMFEIFNEILHDLGIYGAPKVKKGHGMWCKESDLELDNQQSHNLIPQVAKMLGVEIGERFSLKEYPENYYILDVEIGLCEIMGDGKHSRNFILGEIIVGKYTVQKLPQKPKLIEAERVILKNIPKKYKYIARDNSGLLYIYENKPKKDGNVWSNYNYNCFDLFQHLFQFIKWEDEEPYKIQELLEEYENLRSE